MIFLYCYEEDDEWFHHLRPAEREANEELERRAKALMQAGVIVRAFHTDTSHFGPDDVGLVTSRFGEADGISPESPPKVAEFLLRLFVASRDVDVVVGDLEEQYHKDMTKVGALRARRKYYTEAARSILSALWEIVEAAGLWEWIRRMFGI